MKWILYSAIYVAISIHNYGAMMGDFPQQGYRANTGFAAFTAIVPGFNVAYLIMLPFLTNFYEHGFMWSPPRGVL